MTQLKTKQREYLLLRIDEYLSLGGLFNPELANHDQVSLLIRELQDYLRRDNEDDFQKSLKECYVKETPVQPSWKEMQTAAQVDTSINHGVNLGSLAQQTSILDNLGNRRSDCGPGFVENK